MGALFTSCWAEICISNCERFAISDTTLGPHIYGGVDGAWDCLRAAVGGRWTSLPHAQHPSKTMHFPWAFASLPFETPPPPPLRGGRCRAIGAWRGSHTACKCSFLKTDYVTGGKCSPHVDIRGRCLGQGARGSPTQGAASPELCVYNVMRSRVM